MVIIIIFKLIIHKILVLSLLNVLLIHSKIIKGNLKLYFSADKTKTIENTIIFLILDIKFNVVIYFIEYYKKFNASAL